MDMAVLDGDVKFGSYFEEDFDIEVISASTNLKGEGRYGEVSSGVASLRGEAEQANYHFTDQERSVWETGQESEFVTELEPVPDYLLEPLSGLSLEWETIMPHNGGQRLDPLSFCSSLSP